MPRKYKLKKGFTAKRIKAVHVKSYNRRKPRK